ncbi:MAG: hypothetical protein ACTHKR_04120 [Sphingomonas sp.]
MAARLQRWGRSPWLPAIVVGLLWFARYAHDFGFPAAPPWAGWFDQSRYIASVHALMRLDFDAGQHWYPPAYALSALPFAWITPNTPFLIADGVLFALTAAAFARAMRPFGIGPWLAAAIFALSTLAITPIAILWTEPWTTTLSSALLWGLFATLAMLIDGDGKPAAGPLLAVGALVAALPATRPADAVGGIAALIAASLIAARRGVLNRRTVGLVAAGGLAVAIPYGLLYLAIYGPQLSGYIIAGKGQGFAFDDLPWKAYTLLIAARPWFPDGRGLIEVAPFLLPGMAGLLATAVTGSREARRMLALIAVIGLPLLAVQLAYTDFQPPGMWVFGNAHYLIWLLPLGGGGVWLWLRTFIRWREWAVAMAATLAVLALACVRPLPVAVGKDRPARMLQFQGALARQWSEAYFASVVVRDAKGTMKNVGGFHQLPDDHGEREIAISRLFTGPAKRRDPGELPPYNGWQQPYARYAVKLSFGWPCWSRRPECTLR